jgi:hypothetical protein
MSLSSAARGTCHHHMTQAAPDNTLGRLKKQINPHVLENQQYGEGFDG